MTVPELRLIAQGERYYAACVVFVPHGDSVDGKRFRYQIVTDGWSHWGYTKSYAAAWSNVRRALKRHALRTGKA